MNAPPVTFIVGAAAQLVLIVMIRALFIRPLHWRAVPIERLSHA